MWHLRKPKKLAYSSCPYTSVWRESVTVRRKTEMATQTSMIAVLIARVSSKGQEEEGFSLEAQVKILTNYCGPAGLHIGKVYKIAESASKSEQRKIFKEAMDYVAKHNVK